jgi:hypothetical protein
MDLYADHLEADENAQALGTLTLPDAHIKDHFAARLPHDIPSRIPTASDTDEMGCQDTPDQGCRKPVTGTDLVGVGRGETGPDGREAPGGFEPPVEVLQTSALPLGYGAVPDDWTILLPRNLRSKTT